MAFYNLMSQKCSGENHCSECNLSKLCAVFLTRPDAAKKVNHSKSVPDLKVNTQGGCESESSALLAAEMKVNERICTFIRRLIGRRNLYIQL